jgi:HD-GYP domain-containing protein (c-di-GMP phosphodiesterase class II)
MDNSMLDAVREIEKAKALLVKIFNDLDGGEGSLFKTGVEQVIQYIKEGVKLSKHAAISTIFLKTDYAYSVHHPIDAAIIASIIGEGLAQDRYNILLGVALTMNISCIKYQDKLQNFEGKLSEKIRKTLWVHPERSAKLLQQMGIENKEWLDGVKAHHENLDGSGYPKQLKDQDISDVAKIVNIADRYSSMLSARSVRSGMPADKVLKLFMIKYREQLDLKWVNSLIEAVGIYPVGVQVILNSGKKGIVVKPGDTVFTPYYYQLNDHNEIVGEVVSCERGDIKQVCGVKPSSAEAIMNVESFYG